MHSHPFPGGFHTAHMIHDPSGFNVGFDGHAFSYESAQFCKSEESEQSHLLNPPPLSLSLLTFSFFMAGFFYLPN
jgi:hypothetical protein